MLWIVTVRGEGVFGWNLWYVIHGQPNERSNFAINRLWRNFAQQQLNNVEGTDASRFFVHEKSALDVEDFFCNENPHTQLYILGNWHLKELRINKSSGERLQNHTTKKSTFPHSNLFLSVLLIRKNICCSISSFCSEDSSKSRRSSYLPGRWLSWKSYFFLMQLSSFLSWFSFQFVGKRKQLHQANFHLDSNNEIVFYSSNFAISLCSRNDFFFKFSLFWVASKVTVAVFPKNKISPPLKKCSSKIPRKLKISKTNWRYISEILTRKQHALIRILRICFRN